MDIQEDLYNVYCGWDIYIRYIYIRYIYIYICIQVRYFWFLFSEMYGVGYSLVLVGGGGLGKGTHMQVLGLESQKTWELKSGNYDSRWLTISTSLDPIPIASMYGIFTYIYHGKNQPNVGKCTSPMDPCPWYGIWICYRPSHLPKFRLKSKISRPNRRLHPRPFPPFEAGNIIKAVAACFASAFAARGFGMEI